MSLATFSSPAGMSLTKLSLAGNNIIIPARESLVSDIPAGDGKIVNPFLQCTVILLNTCAGFDTHDRGLLCNFSYRHCRQVFHVHFNTLIKKYIYNKIYDDAGNLCVCMVIVKDKSLHTATNYYLFSLAMADLVILVLGTLKGKYREIFYNNIFIFGQTLSKIG